MDAILMANLPLEIVEKISKEVHRLHLREVHKQLKYCVTWIYADKIGSSYCFIVSNNQNYYASLLDNLDQDEWIDKKFINRK